MLRLTHAKEGRDARALYFKNIVIRPNGEIVTGQGEGHIGQFIAFATVNRVLAVETFLCANFLVPVSG